VRSIPSAVLAALAGLLVLACAAPQPRRDAYVFSGETMGTTYEVKVVADDLAREAQEALAEDLAAELAAVDRAMSTYRPDSEVSRFNRFADVTPFPVSDAVFTVFARALTIGRLSGGAFDVTAAPLVRAWGFGAGSAAEPPLPSPEELDRLRQRVGLDKLLLEPSSRSLIKARADVEADLSGIAKGYAVDRLAALLDQRRLADYLIEVGGEMRARGRNPSGRVWRVGIERPASVRRQVQRIVPLADRAMATSGDYRNYRERDGVRLTHIVDPRSGRPIGHRLASATVVAADCAGADAWATAMMVLGPEEGMRRAEENALAVFFLVRTAEGTFAERLSPAFEALLEEAP